MLGRSENDFITVRDVAANDFIAAYAEHLKKTKKVKMIKNAHFIKTGHAQQLNPYSEDWFYYRAAAIARRIYLKPELGINNLRHIFGTRKNNGNSPYSHAPGSGKVIRFALQQLEEGNILMRYNDKRNRGDKNLPNVNPTLLSRIVSPEGRKEMNEIAKQVLKGNK